MTFEDLQSKWQSQDHSVPLDINSNELMAEVRRNHRALDKQLLLRDSIEIAAAFLITVVFTTLAFQLELSPLFLCAAGSLFVGLFFFSDRLKQRRRRSSIADSLPQTLEAAIEEIKHQIWFLRNIMWWYLLPLIPGIVLFLVSSSWQSRANGYAEQLVIAAVGSICAVVFGLIYRINLRDVKKTLEPRLNDLQTLLTSLSSSDSNS